MARRPPPLWAHQRKTKRFAKTRSHVFDTSDPGTGKTRAHLEVFYERAKKHGKAALVVAPKSLLQSAWEADAHTFTPNLRTSVAFAECREEAFEKDADIYIVNTDGVKWLAKQRKKFFDRFDTLIVDESTTFKHATSQRSRALNSIVDRFAHRTLMTGTPNPRTILDLWHQLFLLDRGQRLGPSYYKFRQAVCEPEQRGPSRNMIEWVDKPGIEEVVAELIKDITIRHIFEDCMDIPPNVQHTVPFFLPRKLTRYYEELERDAILQLKSKDITAVNAAVLMNKLLQVASGAVYDNAGNYELLDKARYELVAELIEERTHSVTFFNWKHQKEELSKLLDKRGISHAILDGTVAIAKRKAIIERYQAGHFRTILLHPQTGAHGLTLTRGVATVWQSPIYQADFLKQGLHRIYRGGQKLPTETLMVEAQNTIERKIYARLGQRAQRMRNVLSIFEETT